MGFFWPFVKAAGVVLLLGQFRKRLQLKRAYPGKQNSVTTKAQELVVPTDLQPVRGHCWDPKFAGSNLLTGSVWGSALL